MLVSNTGAVSHFEGKKQTCDNKKGHFVQAFAFHSTTLLDLELVFSLQNVTQNYPTVVIFRQTELNAYECMDGSMWSAIAHF